MADLHRCPGCSREFKQYPAFLRHCHACPVNVERWEVARLELLDAATEIAVVFDCPPPEVKGEKADALRALYAANEAWQRAQLHRGGTLDDDELEAARASKSKRKAVRRA